MWQFIITGYIPGTAIQITFGMLLLITALLLVSAIGLRMVVTFFFEYKNLSKTSRHNSRVQQISL